MGIHLPRRRHVEYRRAVCCLRIEFPLTRGNEYAVLSIDVGYQLRFDRFPRFTHDRQAFDVDRYAVEFHPCDRCHISTPQQSAGEIERTHHFRQQTGQGVDVGLAVIEQRQPLRRVVRAAAHRQLSHFILFDRRYRIESVICQCRQQIDSVRSGSVCRSPLFNPQIEYPHGDGPTQREETTDFRRCEKRDDENIGTNVERGPIGELIGE